MTEGWRPRAEEELSQLEGRIDRLTDFLDTDEYDALPSDQQVALLMQASGMATYYVALKTRLELDDDNET
jgi:hypothetical protein